MNEYSPDKSIHHPATLQILREGGQPNPVHLLLIISDLCSHDCSFCAYRMSGHPANAMFGEIDSKTGNVNNNPKRMIPRDKVIEILDDCVEMGVKAVEFTGGGEPTVHPNHAELFQETISRGLELGLVTHGVLLRPDAIESLMDAKWARVSLDAASSRMYSLIRGVAESQYARVLQNIEALVATKQRTGSNVTLGVSFVITLENWREVFYAASLACKLGVDSFRISAVFQPEGIDYFGTIAPEITAICERAESLSRDGFRVINQWPLRSHDLTAGPPEYENCWYQHFTTVIGGDQNVYRCCNTSYNPRGLIGSVKNQRFADLWQSEEKLQKFTNFDARGCSMCHVNNRNRIINSMVSVPLHVNFV